MFRFVLSAFMAFVFSIGSLHAQESLEEILKRVPRTPSIQFIGIESIRVNVLTELKCDPMEETLKASSGLKQSVETIVLNYLSAGLAQGGVGVVIGQGQDELRQNRKALGLFINFSRCDNVIDDENVATNQALVMSWSTVRWFGPPDLVVGNLVSKPSLYPPSPNAVALISEAAVEQDILEALVAASLEPLLADLKFALRIGED